MMSVMLSIKPKWCELIASGKKTVEVRKTRPQIETPFRCYIYCTKDNKYSLDDGKRRLNGKVIGEFVCDFYEVITFLNLGKRVDFEDYVSERLTQDACLTLQKAFEYANGKPLYGWHISDLVIYNKPKEWNEFRKPLDCHRGIQRDNCDSCWDCEIKRPPQSWCYCEVSKND